MQRKTVARILFWTVWAITSLSTFVALLFALVFRFRHPDLSETRLLMECWPAYAVVLAGSLACWGWLKDHP